MAAVHCKLVRISLLPTRRYNGPTLYGSRRPQQINPTYQPFDYLGEAHQLFLSKRVLSASACVGSNHLSSGVIDNPGEPGRNTANNYGLAGDGVGARGVHLDNSIADTDVVASESASASFQSPSTSEQTDDQTLHDHAPVGTSHQTKLTALRRYRNRTPTASSLVQEGPHSTEQEAARIQSLLQQDLGVSASEAQSLITRAFRATGPSAQLYENCKGWTSHLTTLAGGTSTLAKVVIETYPALLRSMFDTQRLVELEELQSFLNTLGVSQPMLCQLLKRYPLLLVSPLNTIKAAVGFLTAECGEDSNTLHSVLMSHPQLLTSSVPAMQRTLRWLIDTVGQKPEAAFVAMLSLHGYSVDGTLTRNRVWLLQQGFTAGQVASMVRLAPRLLVTSLDVLERRLEFLTVTCGIPVEIVQEIVAKQPVVLAMDISGHLGRLKLQYWQDELGYSLPELQQAPTYPLYSIVRVASRHNALRDLFSVSIPPSKFLSALIHSSGSGKGAFGPKQFAAFLRDQQGNARPAELLRTMASKLSQTENQREWHALLDQASETALEGKEAAQHQRTLFAALYEVYMRDWPLSASGRKWLAAEAAAKAADKGLRANAHAGTMAERAKLKAAKVEQKRADLMGSKAANLSQSAGIGT